MKARNAHEQFECHIHGFCTSARELSVHFLLWLQVIESSMKTIKFHNNAIMYTFAHAHTHTIFIYTAQENVKKLKGKVGGDKSNILNFSKQISIKTKSFFH